MTWVKVCGTTSLHDARLSIAAGADALGFIFAPSPRGIDIAAAAAIIARLPDRVETIGVFVNETPRHVGELLRQVRLSGVQLHGDEPVEQMQEFRRVAGGRKIIKTLQAHHLLDQSDERLTKYLSVGLAIDAILVDSGGATLAGGTGTPFAWTEAAPVLQAIREAMPLIIAGGLNAENVGKAMELFSPWGVDVASGVESEPGTKDEAKLRDFVAAVRQRP